MNIWDILILLVAAAVVLLALRQLRRPRSGCCEAGCGGSCAGCAAACAGRARNEQPESEKTKP